MSGSILIFLQPFPAKEIRNKRTLLISTMACSLNKQEFYQWRNGLSGKTTNTYNGQKNSRAPRQSPDVSSLSLKLIFKAIINNYFLNFLKTIFFTYKRWDPNRQNKRNSIKHTAATRVFAAPPPPRPSPVLAASVSFYFIQALISSADCGPYLPQLGSYRYK